MKRLTLALCTTLLCAGAYAQQKSVENQNRYNHRSEFISYRLRKSAEAQDRSSERYYKPLNGFMTTRDGVEQYREVVEIPILWLERDIFLHTEGGRNSHKVYVNDKLVGSARDSRTPSEFNITPYVKDGMNSIAVAIIRDSDYPEEMDKENRLPIESAYIYAQPRLRIDDLIVSAKPDSLHKNGELLLDVVMNSDYNFEEEYTLCYDIYSPERKLDYYDMTTASIPGLGRDTVHFKTPIYGAMQRLWSATSPKLYDLTVFVKRQKLIMEYVSFKIGFGETTWQGNTIYRNGQAISIKAAAYNAAATPAQTSKDITALKKRGANTIYVSYPQPYWFYDLCDKQGMYVVDRANINTDSKGDDRTVGGTVVNDPAWLDDILERVKVMYYRSRMHPCVIAWSLGGDSGNGYNMYKAYQWLKEQGDSRPTVYAAGGEWNSDLELPKAQF